MGITENDLGVDYISREEALMFIVLGIIVGKMAESEVEDGKRTDM